MSRRPKPVHQVTAKQFDALFHLDETSAVEPLEAPRSWHRRELPQTVST